MVCRPCPGADQLLLSFSDPPARLRTAELIDKSGLKWPLCASINDSCTFGGAPQRLERPPILRHPSRDYFQTQQQWGSPEAWQANSSFVELCLVLLSSLSLSPGSLDDSRLTCGGSACVLCCLLFNFNWISHGVHFHNVVSSLDIRQW